MFELATDSRQTRVFQEGLEQGKWEGEQAQPLFCGNLTGA